MLESMWISGVLVLLVSKYSQIKAKGTSMQMVGADWLKSDKQKMILVVSLRAFLALYHMMDTPLEDSPLLESFVKGDDAYRNLRFKLIPYILKELETFIYTSRCKFEYFEQVDKLVIVLIGLFGKILYYILRDISFFG
ncbi:uncharacterized protein LOC132039586 isoform X2 [Lycium ferocissimum]|uniref:uncharacterized protein LOC132039586 isoform X2 n=1 Tax=Lycium ferocissimum TaxID=112874 RepID=UPI002815BD79|nr:uncharacterized protein LOC132039586 isoform X2 [Lycium ferocissimum]